MSTDVAQCNVATCNPDQTSWTDSVQPIPGPEVVALFKMLHISIGFDMDNLCYFPFNFPIKCLFGSAGQPSASLQFYALKLASNV